MKVGELKKELEKFRDDVDIEMMTDEGVIDINKIEDNVEEWGVITFWE